jgi:hypothetical protein
VTGLPRNRRFIFRVPKPAITGKVSLFSFFTPGKCKIVSSFSFDFTIEGTGRERKLYRIVQQEISKMDATLQTIDVKIKGILN